MKSMLSQKAINIAPSLGTKVSVISWTDVSACNRPMLSPTSKATAKIGKDTRVARTNASRMISNNAAWVILDGHSQDFLISFDDLIANGDRCFDGQF